MVYLLALIGFFSLVSNIRLALAVPDDFHQYSIKDEESEWH